MAELQEPESSSPKVQDHLRQKVELLEKWAKEGVPDGETYPTGPVALRRWKSQKYGLKSWGSPNVASPKANPSLRDRFDKAVATLASGKPVLDSLKLSQLKRDIVALAEQVDVLFREKVKDREKIARLEHSLKLKTAENAELSARLRTLAPLRPV